MAAKRQHSTTAGHATTPDVPAPTGQPADGGGASRNGEPAANGRFFAEVRPVPDERSFTDPVHDSAYYKILDAVKSKRSLLKAIPPVRANPPVMSLDDVLPPESVAAIKKAGQIVFHSVGDTGSLKSPVQQSLVPDHMVEDFNDAEPDRPAFLYHLGDVIYNFGEDEYYFDQFYEPFRNYPAPIFAIPGNHDGIEYSDPSLEAFQRHFCSPTPTHAKQAGGLLRTTMTQPGVYFTLEAPFVTIIGLYSNTLEDPGVVSSEGDRNSPVGDQQLDFLAGELKRLKNTKNAVVLAVHHPPYSGDAVHGPSPRMMKDLLGAMQKAAFYPHAVLSGHAHNYQRFSVKLGKGEAPFIVAGCGGHAVTPVRKTTHGVNYRTPLVLEKGKSAWEKYILDYGYLRLVADAEQLRIEFHESTPSQPNVKSPTDSCVVDLRSHSIISTKSI